MTSWARNRQNAWTSTLCIWLMILLPPNFIFLLIQKRRTSSSTKFNCLQMLCAHNVSYSGLIAQVKVHFKSSNYRTILKVSGNTWGLCNNGTGAIGCGDQEMFRNCADIRIISTFGLPPNVRLPQQPAPNAILLPSQSGWSSRSQLVVRSQVCVPVAAHKNVTGMGQWCQENCLKYPPNCDPNLCECL